MKTLSKNGKLVIRPIPVDTDAAHPPPPSDVLMRHEFTCGFIAPKGSGKTTAICNLLWFYRDHFHTVVVFSPTINNDEKWSWVKKQKLLAKNTELEAFLLSLRKRDETSGKGAVVQAPPYATTTTTTEKDVPDKHTFTGLIPKHHFMAEYNEDTLRALLDEQQKIIDFLTAHGKTKHLANRVLIVFDDLVGSTLFNSRRDSVFKRLNTNHRHYSCSILMVSQAYKEIPKTVRTQFSALILFEIPNEKEVEVIYEENPVGLKRDAWQTMYNHAVEGDYNFLYINYQKTPDMRCMKNFDAVLTYVPE